MSRPTKTVAVFLFVLVLSSLVSADLIMRNFSYTYAGAYPSWVYTDIRINPEISATKTVYCTDEQIPLTVTVPQANWATDIYDAALGSQCNNPGCLFQYSTVLTNQQLNWRTESQMNQLYARTPPYFSSVSGFNSYIPGVTNLVSTQKAHYINPLTGGLFTQNANTYFKSDIGVYCRGRIILVSNIGQFNNLELVPNYAGGSIPAHTISISQQTSNAEFKSKVELTSCISSGRAYNNNPSPPPGYSCPSPNSDYVLLYKNTQFPAGFLSGPINLQVKPRFTCANLPVSDKTVSNQTPPAGGTVNYGFKLQNNRNMEIQVTNIVMSQSSTQQGFTGFSVSPIPSPAIPINQLQAFTGSVTVPPPPASGQKTLKVDIYYKPTSPDCEQNQPTCPMVETFIVNIDVQPLDKPDYIPILSASSATAGQQFTATAITKNQNVGTSTASKTRVRFNGGTPVFFNVPGLAQNAQQVDTQVFTCPTTPGNYSLEQWVDYENTIDEGATGGETNNYKSILVNCQAPSLEPDYIPVITVPSNIYHTETFTYSVKTQNIGGGDAQSPSVTRARFPSIHASPQTKGFLVQALNGGTSQTDSSTFVCEVLGSNALNATADDTGVIAESNENNNFVSEPMTCYAIPDSCTLQFLNHGTVFNSSDTAQVQGTCFAGSSETICPAFSWAQTAQGGSMSPTTTPRANPLSTLTLANAPTPQLNEQVTATSNDPTVPGLTCSVSFNVTGEGPGPGELAIDCGFRNHGPSFYPGESATTEANCTWQNGSTMCPALIWTTNVIQGSLNPEQTAQGPSPRTSLFSIAQTAPVPQYGKNVTIACADPLVCTAFCEAELDVVPEPDRLDCYLINHSNRFTPGDWSWVQGNCTNTVLGMPTACPELEWYTRDDLIIGSDFEPNPTLQQFSPLTNFSIEETAPTPQSGLIDATSNASIVPGLVCEAAISILVDDEFGPDYKMVKVTPSSFIVNIGETVDLEVVISNIGNMDAENYTTTRLTGVDCTLQEKQLRPLVQTEVYTQTGFSCTCTTPGIHTVYASANVYKTQYETNYSNNDGSTVFFCGIVSQLTCPDFV